MKLNCNRIEFDKSEFVYSLTFYEKEQEDDPYGISEDIDKIKESIGPYLMIQKAFAEDEYDEEYLYLESDNPEISGDLRHQTTFILSRRLLKFQYKYDQIEIKLDTIDEKLFKKLKKNLTKILSGYHTLIIDE